MCRWRISLAATTLICVATLASAHEIKVLASQLVVPEPGGKTTVYLSWGHRLPVDDLVDAAPIDRYDLIAPDAVSSPLKKDGISLQANSVTLPSVGVYRVVACRKPGVSTYVLDEQGERQLKRGSKKEVKEGRVESATRYQQCATALIVVGPAGAEPVKPTGLPVEIAPLDPPSAWRRGLRSGFRYSLPANRSRPPKSRPATSASSRTTPGATRRRRTPRARPRCGLPRLGHGWSRPPSNSLRLRPSARTTISIPTPPRSPWRSGRE